MNEPSRAVTTAPDSILSTALTPQSVVAQVTLVQQIMHDVMKKDEHYGAIPGVRVREGDKPKMVLLKPGAEKLCFTFQLVPSFNIDERQMERGHREYRVITRLTTRAGVPVGEGVGTCSTMESKYRYRNAAVKCPTCGKETVIRGKEEYGGGWLCFAKKGGCGAKFPTGDKAIEAQETGKVDNPDPADQYNTVLKMAKKRSIVDATITACAASDIFTQDLEELPEYETAETEPAKPEKRATVTGEVKQKKPEWLKDQLEEATNLRNAINGLGGDKRVMALYAKMKYDAPSDVIDAMANLLRELQDIAAEAAEPVAIVEDRK